LLVILLYLQQHKIVFFSHSAKYTCTACYKSFKSKHTLDCHNNGKRHDWNVKKVTNKVIISTPVLDKSQEVIMNFTQKKKEIIKEDVIETLSEEGYCTDDENKRQAENENTILEITKQIEVANQKEHIKNIENEEYDTIGKTTKIKANRAFKRERGTSRRRKMEELKDMYKHYAASRGSNDLYATMLDSYEDFAKDYGEYEMCRKTGYVGGTPESFRKKRTFSESEKEALMRRDLVLTELADTEKDYVESLGFIVNEYIPLLEQQDVSKQLKDDFEKIFSNIYDIYNFHKRYFLECLEDCLENPENLKDAFCNCEEDLSILYSQYCKGKPIADEALKTNENEMETMRRKYLPQLKLSIKDLLVKPVQRLMKYQLLLCTARKYSFNAGVSTKNIDEAIEAMAYVPKEANDAMHVALITGYDNYLLAEDLLYQDALEVSIGKAKGKSKSMRIFIFESVVIFSETIKRKGRLPIYKCIAHGKTSCMGITEVVENDLSKFAMYFRKFKTTDIFICKAESSEIRINFVTVLKDVVAIYEILQNKVNIMSQAKRKSETNRRQTRNRTRTVIFDKDEAIKLAMQGHPRQGLMSERLIQNIEKFILNEIMNMGDDTNNQSNSNDSNNNNSNNRNRSMSLIPGTSNDVRIISDLRRNSSPFSSKRIAGKTT